MNRRNFIAVSGMALFSLNFDTYAKPAFPTKPVRIVVGFPAGQATDIIARLTSEKMAEGLGQPFIVENKPGAGGGLALAYLEQQYADGYIVSFANTGAVITNRFLQKTLPYQPDQLRPVALLGDIPLVLAVRGDSDISSLENFIEKAKASPGRLTYATPGVGTTSHLAMESLKQAAGIDVLHVPYTGSSRSLTDVVAGNVDISFDTITTVRPFTENGRLKAIAVGATQRLPLMPDVPTLAELGFRDIIGAVWVGAFVPRGTPDTAIGLLAAEIAKVAQDPEMAQKLAQSGLYVRYADPSKFAAVLAEDTPKIQRVVELSGIKAE